MDLDKPDENKHEFHSENKVENIWDNDEEKTTEEKESDDSEHQTDSAATDKTGSEYDHDELEKPSFLRRLTGKGKQKEDKKDLEK
jgi:hypothetical protein